MLLSALLPLTAEAAKPRTGQSKPRTSTDARRQRSQTERQMRQTSRQLTSTERELAENLRKISALEESIERSTARAARLKQRIDSIAVRSAAVSDSIARNEAELKRLRELYTRAVRSSRRNRREMNSLTFIFSARTFRQAWRRMHYLEQYGRWRRRKTDEINGVMTELNLQKERLEEMKRQTASLRSEALAEERRLRTDREKLQRVAGSLKGRTRELNSLLQRQQSTMRSLDDEIERLIQREEEERKRREEEERKRREAEEAKRRAEEARRQAEQAAASTRPSPTPSPTPAPAPAPEPATHFEPSPATKIDASGSFAAQKGKLPSPLSHTYVVALGFGRQQHRSVSNLEVNNPGVDLETAVGATARAVFPGTVSAVFVQDGLGHVVLVRHGNYLTVYANIQTLKVSKGTKLKTGDVIGIVGPSDVNPQRALLHFEIRREREKLDPRLWLKR